MDGCLYTIDCIYFNPLVFRSYKNSYANDIVFERRINLTWI